MQHIPDGAQLRGADMLDAAFDLHQRFARHIHTVQLKQAHQFGLADVRLLSHGADILADLDFILLDLLLRHTPTSRKRTDFSPVFP